MRSWREGLGGGNDRMVLPDLSGWLVGAAGGAFLVFLTWAFGTFLNWRVNDRVRKELAEVNVKLALIIEGMRRRGLL